MSPRSKRDQLVLLLQLAYSGELAAAYAYRGHWHSLTNSEERLNIQKIENEQLLVGLLIFMRVVTTLKSFAFKLLKASFVGFRFAHHQCFPVKGNCWDM